MMALSGNRYNGYDQVVTLEARMPLVYRAMKKDDDGLPTVESTASGLGVRTGLDIDVDSQGNAIANGKGMSVSPSWRVMPVLAHSQATAR